VEIDLARCFNCKYWKEIGVKHGGFLMGMCSAENLETVNIGYCIRHFPVEQIEQKETKGED